MTRAQILYFSITDLGISAFLIYPQPYQYKWKIYRNLPNNDVNFVA